MKDDTQTFDFEEVRKALEEKLKAQDELTKTLEQAAKAWKDKSPVYGFEHFAEELMKSDTAQALARSFMALDAVLSSDEVKQTVEAIKKQTESVQSLLAKQALSNLPEAEQVKTAFEAIQAALAQVHGVPSDDDQSKRKKYTKRPLVLDPDGERPEKLNFRNTAVLDFGGTIYKPNKVERYILDGFVFYNTKDEESVKHADETTELAKRNLSFPDFRRFIELRNVELTLYYLDLNLNNDFWLYLQILDMMTEAEQKKDKTEEEQEAFENLRFMQDIQCLRLTKIFEAVDGFLKAHNVPEFLTFGHVLLAKKTFEEKRPKVLFDTLNNSAQAHEFELMFSEYLKKSFEKF